MKNKQHHIAYYFCLIYFSALVYPVYGQPSASFAIWKDNKKAAYTIIHDDYSNYVTGIYQYADPIATARGIKICFGAITNYCGSTEWSQARTMIAHGHECINHTHNHKCGGSSGQCSGLQTYSSGDFATELDLSTTLIETNTLVRPRFFIHPYDAASTDITNHLTSLGYLGARAGTQSAVNTNTFSDFMHLNYHVYSPNSTIASLNQAVDAAIVAQGYVVREFHGIDDGSWAAMTATNYTNHLDYVKSKMDAGDLWSATAAEAITYKMQRDAFLPVTSYSATTKEVTVAFTNVNPIDDKILTTPVTLNINLNGLSGSYYVTQNGATVPSIRQGNILTANIYPHRGSVVAKMNVIPVELTTLNAKVTDTNVHLTWETASEKGSDYFIIERRTTNNTDFEAIGRLKAAGHSSKWLTYNWHDHTPHDGIAYYRLKQVDLDGSFAYSKALSVSYGTESKVKIFPTFTEGVVFIDNLGKTIEDIQVLNHVGQMVLQSKQTILDVSALPKGVYIVRVKTHNRQFVEKIMKQ